MSHPKNGVTLWFPQPSEAIVKTYGQFDGSSFTRLIGDAFRVVEHDTGNSPAANLTLHDGVIEVRVTG